jgi:LacI family transcriptional regulator
MENSKDVTIYDIAKNLDVSPSTVSKALNDDPAISKKTRKKILETAALMGYRTNPHARNLRQRQSLTIGVIVYELNNSFMASVLSGIETVANETGYGIIIMDSAQSTGKEVANAQSLFHRRVDGVIAFPAPDTKQLDHFNPFIAKNIPVIFLDHAGQVPESTSVIIDNVLCGHMATMHLIEQGCRRIAHLTSTLDHDIYALRYKGYIAALKENHLPFEEALLITAPPTEVDSLAAAGKLMNLQPMPDGLFVTNDLAAAVCIRTFLDRGVRVPRDIAVVGFNNDIVGRLIKPSLTTINYPGREMGDRAARNLVNHLKGMVNMNKISTTTIRAELIIRQSSLKKG